MNIVLSISFFSARISKILSNKYILDTNIEVVEKPKDFIKNTKVNGDKSELNKSQSERLEFWNQFNDVLIEKEKPFNIREATTDHWYDVAIGTSAVHIGITLVNKASYIGVEFYINDDKEMLINY